MFRWVFSHPCHSVCEHYFTNECPYENTDSHGDVHKHIHMNMGCFVHSMITLPYTNNTLPNFSPRYLKMLTLPPIVVPSTVRYGLRPNGDSGR